MTKGILCFAFNNESIDYIKQAKFLAARAKNYLNLPVSVVTDSTIEDSSLFDKVIKIDLEEKTNNRRYYNGMKESHTINFKNSSRTKAYDLSPYDNTLILDTDYVICSTKLLEAFDSGKDFLIHDSSFDVAYRPENIEFKFLSDTGIKFYWATCVFFKKTKTTKAFFDLLKHIQDNWNFYSSLYCLPNELYRNDYSFSIAIHIMNGYVEDSWVSTFTFPTWYITDKDYLYELKNETIKILSPVFNEVDVELPIIIKNTDVHIMNKYSLEDHINV